MKKLSFIVLLCLACSLNGFAQNSKDNLKLRADNIEEILNAMTIGRKSPCWSAALEVLCLVPQATPVKSSVSASR